jgi:hypothetical protein
MVKNSLILKIISWLTLILIITFFLGSMLYAQEEFNETTPEPDSTEEKSSGSEPSPPVSNVNLDGFNETKWESSYKEVKKILKNLATSKDSPDKVKILYEEQNEYILIRRNGIRYTYRFYAPPSNIIPIKYPDKKEDHPEYEKGRLFYVSIKLPMLMMDDVREALEKKYKESTKQVLDDSENGVLIWELNGGFVFQWQEKFEGKLYTRRVDYLSSKLKEEITKDYALYYTAKEKKILKKAKL